MRIVIDTNVLVSGVFFGGPPRRILEAVIDSAMEAYACPEIIAEYQETMEEMICKKYGHFDENIIGKLLQKFRLIEPVKFADVCRDPDDNKFLDCARDSQALYIVSGDKDLLVVRQYGMSKIVTARDFCDQYL